MNRFRKAVVVQRFVEIDVDTCSFGIQCCGHLVSKPPKP